MTTDNSTGQRPSLQRTVSEILRTTQLRAVNSNVNLQAFCGRDGNSNEARADEIIRAWSLEKIETTPEKSPKLLKKFKRLLSRGFLKKPQSEEEKQALHRALEDDGAIDAIDNIVELTTGVEQPMSQGLVEAVDTAVLNRELGLTETELHTQPKISWAELTDAVRARAERFRNSIRNMRERIRRGSGNRIPIPSSLTGWLGTTLLEAATRYNLQAEEGPACAWNGGAREYFTPSEQPEEIGAKATPEELYAVLNINILLSALEELPTMEDFKRSKDPAMAYIAYEISRTFTEYHERIAWKRVSTAFKSNIGLHNLVESAITPVFGSQLAKAFLVAYKQLLIGAVRYFLTKSSPERREEGVLQLKELRESCLLSNTALLRMHFPVHVQHVIVGNDGKERIVAKPTERSKARKTLKPPRISHKGVALLPAEKEIVDAVNDGLDTIAKSCAFPLKDLRQRVAAAATTCRRMEAVRRNIEDFVKEKRAEIRQLALNEKSDRRKPITPAEWAVAQAAHRDAAFAKATEAQETQGLIWIRFGNIVTGTLGISPLDLGSPEIIKTATIDFVTMRTAPQRQTEDELSENAE